MTANEARLLVVGVPSAPTQAVLEQASQRGAQQFFARSIREALLALEAARFDAVLATEILPDGRAYELTSTIEKRGGSFLVAVALSESALWLPVVDRGQRVLGSRALNAHMLGPELDRLTVPPLHSAATRVAASLRAAAGPASARGKILARRAAALPLRLESSLALDARHEPFDPSHFALAAAQQAEKEGRYEMGRFERACRRTAAGGRRTA